jgi:hypothetical protein
MNIKNSNKLLLIIILFSVILSITSTIIILSNNQDNLTAKATEVEGIVKLKIEQTLSIVIIDGDIYFGTCELNKTKTKSIFDTNKTKTEYDNADCPDGIFPDYFLLRNTGTTNANVYVRVDKTGSTFFNDANSSLAYVVLPFSPTSGCNGAYPKNYVNITSANTNNLFCSYFTPSNDIKMSLRAYLSPKAKGGGNLYFTFVGSIV